MARCMVPGGCYTSMPRGPQRGGRCGCSALERARIDQVVLDCVSHLVDPATEGDKVEQREASGEKARTEVGIAEIHLHLRHLAGTVAATIGASTKDVMYRLGHATHQTALRYQRDDQAARQSHS